MSCDGGFVKEVAANISIKIDRCMPEIIQLRPILSQKGSSFCLPLRDS